MTTVLTVIEEQRYHTRQGVALPAWLSFRHSPPLAAWTVDVSPAGASFRSIHPVHEGEPVLLAMQFRPLSLGLQCKAGVVWCRWSPGAARFAVRFLDLTDDEHERLCVFLAASEQNTPEPRRELQLPRLEGPAVFMV